MSGGMLHVLAELGESYAELGESLAHKKYARV